MCQTRALADFSLPQSRFHVTPISPSRISFRLAVTRKMGKGCVWPIPTRNRNPLEMRGGVHQQNYGSRQREGSRLRRTIVGLSQPLCTHTRTREAQSCKLSAREFLSRDPLFAQYIHSRLRPSSMLPAYENIFSHRECDFQRRSFRRNNNHKGTYVYDRARIGKRAAS